MKLRKFRKCFYCKKRKQLLIWILFVGVTILLNSSTLTDKKIQTRNLVIHLEKKSGLFVTRLFKSGNSLFIYNKKNVHHAMKAESKLHPTLPMRISNFSKNNKSFNINGTDVVVLLHIQKTGGTMLTNYLVQYLDIKKPCKYTNKRNYICHRPNDNTTWLFSKKSSGGWLCGLHASWTSLMECVPKKFTPTTNGERKFFYITMLRDPIARFLSEWRHFQRGATWSMSYLICNGNYYYTSKSCWSASETSAVTLNAFVNCSYNAAFNRQTHMLADKRQVNCTGESMDPLERDRKLLESAKRNLQDMAFFGLLEKLNETKLIFESTFHWRFKRDFQTRQEKNRNKPVKGLTTELLKIIKEKNFLDVELYKFAVKLFDQRYNAATTNKITSDIST